MSHHGLEDLNEQSSQVEFPRLMVAVVGANGSVLEIAGAPEFVEFLESLGYPELVSGLKGELASHLSEMVQRWI